MSEQESNRCDGQHEEKDATTGGGDGSGASRIPGGLEPSTVQPARGLVAAAAGAIVSRTLIRTGGGSVTAFALDAGQSISEHSAPFDALVHLVEGAMVVTIGGREHRLVAGDVLLMPADVPHALRADERATFLLTMLREAPVREKAAG